jgi:translocation and assembly module TamB
MSEQKPRSNARQRLVVQGVLGLAILAAIVSAAMYFTSDHFRDFMRRRLVTRLEEITGGKVEIGSFRWNLSRLEFDVHDLTIHGTEGPGEVPYAHVDHLVVNAKILSVVQREIGLSSVVLERPVIHVIVYPDGRTNQPTPKLVSKQGGPVQSLFKLAISRIEVKQGEVVLNAERFPLDFQAQNVKATMDHVANAERYDGKITLSNFDAKYARFLPANADADLAFSLFENKLEMSSFRLLSGKSKLDASGKLADFRHPVAEVTYVASLDAQELARVTKIKGVRGGSIQLNGAAIYAGPGSLRSKGKLGVNDFSYRDAALSISNLDAGAQFDVDPNHLAVSNLTAKTLGGVFTGQIKVTNWLLHDTPAVSHSVQTGTATIRFEHFPIGVAAGMLSTGKYDLARLHLAGNGQGTLQVDWKGSFAHALANLDLSVAPPAQPGPRELPVTAEIKTRANLGSGVIQVDSFNATLPDMRFGASGVLGGRADRLRLSVEVADLTRLRPMLTAMKQQGIPLSDLTGQFSFDGTVAGKMSAPIVEGRVKLKDFGFPLQAVLANLPDVLNAAHSQPRPQRIQVDSATATVSYSPQGITIRNGELRRGTAQAAFDVSALLVDGELTDKSPVTARLSVQDASLADLQQVAGYNYPIRGTVAGNLNISGSRANPQGGGHVQITNAVVYDEPIKSASADLQLLGQQARISNFQVIHNGARIAGAGSYNLKTTAFQFNVVGNNFELSRIRKINSGRGTLAGGFSFIANGSGTVANPIINGTARVQNLFVNGQRVGDATLLAVTQGDTLRLTGRSNFRNAELTSDGTIKIQSELFPANITVRFSNFDFMPFLQPIFQGKLSGKSYVGGTVTIQGPLRHPRDLTVVVEIPTLRADLQGVQVSNPEPIRATMINQVVQIESFRLVGKDTEMNARGRIDLNGDTRVRVRASGKMNLKLAQSFNPDLNSEGLIDFNMNIGGVVKKPTVQGEVRITNGSFNFIDFPNGLSNVNGSVLFTEDRVQVQNLAAHTGGGDIQIGGYATYSPQLGFNLTATGQDIRMRYPRGVSSTANIDLKLTGTLNNSLLSGDVTVTRFGLNNQFDLADYLAKSNRPADTPHASPLNNLRLNVHVVSTPELQVQSSLAKLAGNVDLNVRGVASNPIVLGRVSASEGQLILNGQTYRLERGDVTFSNPAKTEPTLDVEATTRVRDYDLTVRMVGQPSRGLKPTFRSDPPLPDADIVNLLAFGRTREETQIASSQTSTAFTNSVSEAVLGQAINTAVSSRVQRLFGVSRVKISPELGGSTQTTNPTAQVTIEQSVSDKVTITYITNLAQSSQQSIFVEYNVNRNVSLIAGRDQYGVVSFDVRVRQRKR